MTKLQLIDKAFRWVGKVISHLCLILVFFVVFVAPFVGGIVVYIGGMFAVMAGLLSLLGPAGFAYVGEYAVIMVSIFLAFLPLVFVAIYVWEPYLGPAHLRLIEGLSALLKPKTGTDDAVALPWEVYRDKAHVASCKNPADAVVLAAIGLDTAIEVGGKPVILADNKVLQILHMAVSRIEALRSAGLNR